MSGRERRRGPSGFPRYRPCRVARGLPDAFVSPQGGGARTLKVLRWIRVCLVILVAMVCYYVEAGSR